MSFGHLSALESQVRACHRGEQQQLLWYLECLVCIVCRYQRDSEMCGKLTQSLHHLTTPYEQELQLWQREGETGPIITLQNIKPCLKYLQVPEGLRDV